MLSKRPLTDRAIQALKPAPGVAYRLLWDAVVPGFAVRVTATSQKSFVLVTRFPRSPNPTARSLGKVGAITLEDARIKGTRVVEADRCWHRSSGSNASSPRTRHAASYM